MDHRACLRVVERQSTGMFDAHSSLHFSGLDPHCSSAVPVLVSTTPFLLPVFVFASSSEQSPTQFREGRQFKRGWQGSLAAEPTDYTADDSFHLNRQRGQVGMPRVRPLHGGRREHYPRNAVLRPLSLHPTVQKARKALQGAGPSFHPTNGTHRRFDSRSPSCPFAVFRG